MNLRPFFISTFSLLFFLGYGQKKKKEKWDYHPNYVVGIDLLHLGLAVAGQDRMIQGFVSSTLTKSIHAVADVGQEKNTYDKNGYDVDASGVFVRLGGFYMLAPDPQNIENGFYIGGKVAASFYNQDLKSIPIRWIQGMDSFASFPGSSQSAYWLEGAVGGRIEILGSHFLIDVQAQPKILMYTTKQENITPMVIPGFGKDATRFKIGFMWNLAYRF